MAFSVGDASRLNDVISDVLRTKSVLSAEFTRQYPDIERDIVKEVLSENGFPKEADTNNTNVRVIPISKHNSNEWLFSIFYHDDVINEENHASFDTDKIRNVMLDRYLDHFDFEVDILDNLVSWRDNNFDIDYLTNRANDTLTDLNDIEYHNMIAERDFESHIREELENFAREHDILDSFLSADDLTSSIKYDIVMTHTKSVSDYIGSHYDEIKENYDSVTDYTRRGFLSNYIIKDDQTIYTINITSDPEDFTNE